MKNRLPKTNPYRKSIFVPAEGKRFACTVHVHLTPEEIPEVQTLADKLGLSLDELVRTYIKPERPMSVHLKKPPAVKLERIALLPALSPEAVARIERAAKVYEVSLETFIADAIAGAAHGAEDIMLLDPHTGELIGEDFLASLLLRDVVYYQDGKPI